MNYFTESYPGAHGLKFSETKGASVIAYFARKNEHYKFPDGKEWKVIEVRTDASGFRAIVLKAENDPRTILAFAGTDPTSLPDLQTDIDQEKGLIPIQYTIAESMAVNYKSQGRLILTGHSLGGGLAAYSSMRTGVPVTTINPAPLAASTVEKYGNYPTSNHRVTNYIAGGKEVISDVGVNGLIFILKPVLAPAINSLNPTPIPLKLVLLGNAITISGSGFPCKSIAYFRDHNEYAPEVPNPEIIQKSLNSPPAKFPNSKPEWIQPPPF